MNTALQSNQLNAKRKNLWGKFKTLVSPDAKKLEWYEIADLLDDHAPEWRYAVKHVGEVGERAVVIATITIEGVTREGVGSGSSETEIGIRNAEAKALKSAAAKFGLGRDFEMSELKLVAKTPEKINIGFSGDPVAHHGHDFCTPKQIGMMRAVCRELDCDLEDKCNEVFPGVKSEQLSKKAASSFIQHLREIEKQKKDGITPAPSTVAAFPQTTENFNPGQIKQIEQWREEIRLGTGKIGFDPLNYIPEFDTHSLTFAAKQKTHESVMNKVCQMQREQIGKGLATQNWSEAHELAELAKHGIRGELKNASRRQIDSLWADFKRARII